MKKQVFALMALGLVASLSAAVCAAELPSISVKKAPADVKIDAVFDDQWKDATLMVVGENDATTSTFGKIWGKVPDDCKVWVMWDANCLYFFAEKEDDVVTAPIVDPGAGAPWLDDSIGMFLEYPGGGGFKVPISVPTEEGEMLMGWAPVGPGGAQIRPEIGTAKFKMTKTGYNMEAKLLWSELGDFTPVVGDVAKFTPLIMDRDDESGTDNAEWGQTMWCGDGDNPAVYADMAFVK